MHKNEIVRGTFLSKPGDAFENSYYLVLRYLNNGAITVELTTNKNEKFEIPFYLLFRALGMTRDRDIINHIVYGVDNVDPVTISMMETIEKSFEVTDARFEPNKDSIDPIEIISYIAAKITDTANNVAAQEG